jgi:DNA uptake protein ComE-like DNA-binding protein
MYSILEPFKNWFGFTRRERRSSFILLVMIIVILGARYTVPESRITIKNVTDTLTAYADLSYVTKSDSTHGKLSYATFPVSGRKSGQQSYKKYVSKKPLIEINKSDSAALVELPGIGPVLSARIIRYRRLLGGFATIDQLKEVYGLQEETFELIKGRVFADSTLVTKISINSSGYRELSRLPYFEKYEVTAILKYRELKGRINNLNELSENKLITVEKASKLRPYLRFD